MAANHSSVHGNIVNTMNMAQPHCPYSLLIVVYRGTTNLVISNVVPAKVAMDRYVRNRVYSSP